MTLFPAFGAISDLVLAFAVVFARVGALALVLPPMTEGSLPGRIRLALGVVLALVVYPMAADDLAVPEDAGPFLTMILGECLIGLAIGLLLRLAMAALQICGSIIAQSTSMAQMMGMPGLEPSPAIGHLLVFGGVTLAMIFDLHIRLAVALAGTYDLVPMGGVLAPGALAELGVSRVASLFALAFSLAAPFTIAAFLYNLALGIANRAMPQLMVVLVGAPAIVGATLALLAVASPHMLTIWLGAFERVLDAPLGAG